MKKNRTSSLLPLPSNLFPLTSSLLLLLLLTSCHKTCTCIGYNGVADTYTADEVDDRGVTCPDMVFFGGVQYYSVCSWD